MVGDNFWFSVYFQILFQFHFKCKKTKELDIKEYIGEKIRINKPFLSVFKCETTPLQLYQNKHSLFDMYPLSFVMDMFWLNVIQ